MRTGLFSYIFLCSVLLSGCSGTSVMDYIGFGQTSITSDLNALAVESSAVKDFAKTCVQNANDFGQIKQAAYQAGWQPASRAYLLLNGFKNISVRRDILNRRGSKVQALKKISRDTTSILLFYKLKYKQQSQVKCELYANGEPRERVYTALNSLINRSPLRNKKTEHSHLSVWQLKKHGNPFTVRYLYEYNTDDLLDFNGVMIWTHYS